MSVNRFFQTDLSVLGTGFFKCVFKRGPLKWKCNTCSVFCALIFISSHLSVLARNYLVSTADNESRNEEVPERETQKFSHEELIRHFVVP